MSKPKAYITRELPERGLKKIKEHFDAEVWPEYAPPPRKVIVDKVAAVDARVSLLSDKIDPEVFNAAPKLKIVSQLAVGFDNIDIAVSSLLSNALSLLQPVNPTFNGSLVGILWNGVFGGLVAGITLVVPYVIPFYAMLAMIEDSGILTRVAFMMDTAMHKIGLHGKALIPLIL